MSCLNDLVRKALRCKRIYKPKQKFDKISTECRIVKVQLTFPHRNFISGIGNLEIIYQKLIQKISKKNSSEFEQAIKI